MLTNPSDLSNLTVSSEEEDSTTTQYQQLLADVWIGVVLTLLLLSCVCCMCSCLLYHKFQQWKRSVLQSNEDPEIISVGMSPDCESLPSYTIASGLPSYDEALRQLEVVKTHIRQKKDLPRKDSACPLQNSLSRSVSKVSVLEYLHSLVVEKT